MENNPNQYAILTLEYMVQDNSFPDIATYDLIAIQPDEFILNHGHSVQFEVIMNELLERDGSLIEQWNTIAKRYVGYTLPNSGQEDGKERCVSYVFNTDSLIKSELFTSNAIFRRHICSLYTQELLHSKILKSGGDATFLTLIADGLQKDYLKKRDADLLLQSKKMHSQMLINDHLNMERGDIELEQRTLSGLYAAIQQMETVLSIV